ncbi:hypothetical protein DFJ73DRAFT_342356 [Zopfochytrium polystomum]|nr:hypothetical protein DFJ73DRAFT_342356 [Zopfochytrium polystomum]
MPKAHSSAPAKRVGSLRDLKERQQRERLNGCQRNLASFPSRSTSNGSLIEPPLLAATSPYMISAQQPLSRTKAQESSEQIGTALAPFQLREHPTEVSTLPKMTARAAALIEFGRKLGSLAPPSLPFASVDSNAKDTSNPFALLADIECVPSIPIYDDIAELYVQGACSLNAISDLHAQIDDFDLADQKIDEEIDVMNGVGDAEASSGEEDEDILLAREVWLRERDRHLKTRENTNSSCLRRETINSTQIIAPVDRNVSNPIGDPAHLSPVFKQTALETLQSDLPSVSGSSKVATETPQSIETKQDRSIHFCLTITSCKPFTWLAASADENECLWEHVARCVQPNSNQMLTSNVESLLAYWMFPAAETPPSHLELISKVLSTVGTAGSASLHADQKKELDLYKATEEMWCQSFRSGFANIREKRIHSLYLLEPSNTVQFANENSALWSFTSAAGPGYRKALRDRGIQFRSVHQNFKESLLDKRSKDSLPIVIQGPEANAKYLLFLVDLVKQRAKNRVTRFPLLISRGPFLHAALKMPLMKRKSLAVPDDSGKPGTFTGNRMQVNGFILPEAVTDVIDWIERRVGGIRGQVKITLDTNQRTSGLNFAGTLVNADGVPSAQIFCSGKNKESLISL